MTDIYADVDFFTDPSLVDDPFRFFAHLRESCPVAHLAHHGVVGVTGYEEAHEALRSNDRFSSCNSASGPFPGFTTQPEGDDIVAFIAEHRTELPMSEYMITEDVPTHDQTRSLIARLFTPRRMRENEEAMWVLADRQIDEFIDRGRFEVMRDFGQGFAVLVIADLLGVPEDERAEFRRNLGALPTVSDGAPNQMSHDPLGFLIERFSEHVEARRLAPADDVLTQIATATFPDGSIPPVDVVARMAAFLFAAGQDTTARLICAAMHVIAERPDIQTALRSDPGLIPNFVEEVLRTEGPVKSIGRMTQVTTVLGGVEIPAGTVLSVFPGGANRDPLRFEDPDEFRHDRPNAKEHLAFGRGIHACPGGPLARIEARISIERLLARTTDIRIDPEQHGPPEDRRYQQEPIYILRGLQALHLEFTPAATASVAS
ncbi:MAG: cytochrome [Ilumatobacteraceae bacterium]|nr:cytochrome [Ilumatobacteraceae bacterium]